jgi:hypothetical protein
MAAKNASTPEYNLAAGLAAVRPVLAAWRQRRRHREAIPERIWRMIVPLAQAHGVSPVAQALGLNYTALKHHSVRGRKLPPGKPTRDFVEVAVASWPGAAAPGRIELEDRHGTKLTLQLAGGEVAAVLALAQGLWRQRR